MKALAAAGQAPSVERADGSLGYPPHAPYDRIIATCTVSHVPPAWIAQTRPGGIIVTPWALPQLTWGGLLARLQVIDNKTAAGRFIAAVGFMWLRGQRRGRSQPPPGIREPTPAGAATSTTTINPVTLLFSDYDVAFPALLRLGDGAYDFTAKGIVDGALSLYVWLSDPASGSWARIQVQGPLDATPFHEGTVAPVEQYGPRRLWDEIEAAHHWWQHIGQPGPLRFGLTVTPDQQVVWLDTPEQPVSFLSPTPMPSRSGRN